MSSTTVMTIRLQSYVADSQTNSSSSVLTRRDESQTSNNPLSLYLAYLPTSAATQLQDMVKNTSSPFYTLPSNSVAKALAQNIDPTYDILKMQSVTSANRVNQQVDKTGSDDKLRNALIGVGSSLAACIIAFLAWRVWKNNKKQSRRIARQSMMAGGVGQRATIQSFGTGNTLRETWTPSVYEQERVLHGQLAETWEHNEAEPEMVEVNLNPQHPETAFSNSIDHGDGSSNEHSDPFHEAAANQASQETERSGGCGTLRNTLLSHLNSFENSRSRGSLASALTESQRIQQNYIESNSIPSPSQGAISSTAPNDAIYQEVYDRPQQFTSSHAFGPRAVENRSKRRASKGSISSSSIGRPEMQANSMMV